MNPVNRPSSAVKTLGLVALALGVASLAANGYVVVETPYGRDTLKLLAYAAFGSGLLAVLLGIVGGLKKFPVAWLGIPLGAAGALWQFSWAV